MLLLNKITKIYKLKKYGSQTCKILNDKLVKVGFYTYGYPKITHYNPNSKCFIGNFCSIAKNVNILLGGDHNIKNVTSYSFASLKNILEIIQI